MPYILFWVKYCWELCFPWEPVFKAARDENYFCPVAILFRKKKKTRRKERRTHIWDVLASWKKVKCLYLYSTDTAFTQHKHDKYSLQTKGQMPADKRFSKGTWNSKLTQDKFMARMIFLQFSLVKKKLVSIKTTHALYGNLPLTVFFASKMGIAHLTVMGIKWECFNLLFPLLFRSTMSVSANQLHETN